MKCGLRVGRIRKIDNELDDVTGRTNYADNLNSLKFRLNFEGDLNGGELNQI